MSYPFQEFEKKWIKKWLAKKIFQVKQKKGVPKKYILDMFPYPSGAGLHVGHIEGYTATDILTRFWRMQGVNVLHPMGWDAFGLPAENYAIKYGVHPKISTQKNIRNIKRQIQRLGFAYDWSREINTTDPNYYKWTQWIFLKFYEKGLVYRADIPINWCPSCKTGLANEEVIDGRCERCQSEVVQKNLPQWLMRITEYAEKLLKNLEELKWPEKIKEMQKNWIGRSEGVIINFKGIREEMQGQEIHEKEYLIPVFTTRPDTLFGVTYLVLAPEHPLVKELVSPEEKPGLKKFLDKIKKKTELERIGAESAKEGHTLGAAAIHPLTGEKIPIWVADYVLLNYGTGAVMGVPAHDERDFQFAKKYGLKIKPVIVPPHETSWIAHDIVLPKKFLDQPYTGLGYLTNSQEFTGLTSEDAKVKIADYLESKKLGRREVFYHIHDWVFARQRYWGEPIPLVYCPRCAQAIKEGKLKTKNKGMLLNPGWIPLPEKQLPLKLPPVKKYQPTGTGESPLALVKNWVQTRCPICHGQAKRETNTMPQWAGSCWYYLRYLDPKNKKEFVNRKKEKYWMLPKGVDLYVGGAEHAVLHLLYARFWHRFLYDLKLVSTPEPFYELKNQGTILGEDHQKMSKSRGNVINPDEIIEKYGADALRMHEMFMGDFEETKPWNTQSMLGITRFLDKVWQLQEKVDLALPEDSDLETKKKLHQTIKKVTEDIQNFKFNTAISALMVLVNHFLEKEKIAFEVYHKFLLLLHPFAPFITEEINDRLSRQKKLKPKFLIQETWPQFDQSLIEESFVDLIVQVNGKTRQVLRLEKDLSEERVKEIALQNERVQAWIRGQEIKKVVFVKNKLINFVLN